MTDQDKIIGDISIDEHSLDSEWTFQPRLYFRYAAKLADARRELDQAKTELDLVKAELDQSIRANPEKFGLAKVTEAAVTAAIPTQKEHVKARDAMGQAKHAVDVLEAAVGALDHRKRALENLVTLHLANYYSSPKAPAAAKEEMDEVGRRAVRRGRRRETSDD